MKLSNTVVQWFVAAVLTTAAIAPLFRQRGSREVRSS
jgi:hypothetical protein